MLFYYRRFACSTRCAFQIICSAIYEGHWGQFYCTVAGQAFDSSTDQLNAIFISMDTAHKVDNWFGHEVTTTTAGVLVGDKVRVRQQMQIRAGNWTDINYKPRVRSSSGHVWVEKCIKCSSYAFPWSPLASVWTRWQLTFTCFPPHRVQPNRMRAWTINHV